MAVEASNPACGDTLRLWVLWEGSHVAQAAYKARGCTASIAAGSALTELLLGKSREELKALTADDIETAVGGLPPEARHAAALCFDAIRALLAASAVK